MTEFERFSSFMDRKRKWKFSFKYLENHTSSLPRILPRKVYYFALRTDLHGNFRSSVLQITRGDVVQKYTVVVPAFSMCSMFCLLSMPLQSRLLPHLHWYFPVQGSVNKLLNWDLVENSPQMQGSQCGVAF